MELTAASGARSPKLNHSVRGPSTLTICVSVLCPNISTQIYLRKILRHDADYINIFIYLAQNRLSLIGHNPATVTLPLGRPMSVSSSPPMIHITIDSYTPDFIAQSITELDRIHEVFASMPYSLPPSLGCQVWRVWGGGYV